METEVKNYEVNELNKIEKEIINYGNIDNTCEKDNRVYRVYAHIAPNGKMYIGQTCQTLKQRAGSNNGSSYSRMPYFINAIKKYGWKNFKHIVLIDGLSKEMADIVEIELIKKYKTIERQYGYNCDQGGALRKKGRPIYQYDLNGNFIREYSCSRELSIIFNIDRRIFGSCLRGECASCMGYMWSYEKKDKIKPYSEIMPKRIYGDVNTRTVYQYDLDGNFIKEYESCKKAAEEIGIKYDANIYSCANSESSVKSSYGFQWSFEYHESIPKYEPTYIYKTVYQYDLNGNYLNEYKSVSVASKILGVEIHNLFSKNVKRINGVIQSQGYYWSYTKYDKIDKDTLEEFNFIKRKDSRTIYQYSIDGNFINSYPSLKTATTAVIGYKKKSGSSISNCCKGKQYTTYGFIWSFTPLSKEEVINIYHKSNDYKRSNKEKKKHDKY